jgi:hypothetical protein
MLSMPLTRPSALDRRNRAALATVTTSDVEEYWSPALLRFLENRKLKQKLYFSFDFPGRSTEGPFSLGWGLILDQRLLN